MRTMAKKRRVQAPTQADEHPVEVKPLRLFQRCESPHPLPPVDTRLQTLPLAQLSWENFERLCFRLASRAGDAEYWQLYGTPGQKQDGIDIYVRLRSGRYHTWQCKHYETFGVANISKAVDEFLAGKWRASTDTFFLCVQASLADTKLQDEIEQQAKRLRGELHTSSAGPLSDAQSALPALAVETSDGAPATTSHASNPITFIPLDGPALSECLRQYPKIVFEFFGPEWVRKFCGEDAARGLEHHLTSEEYTQLRHMLQRLYRAHFVAVDSGILSTSPHSGKPLPLEQRYILPDIEETRTIVSHPTDKQGQGPALEGGYSTTGPDGHGGHARSGLPHGTSTTHDEILRRPALEWLVEGERTVILGDPGSGKSTLLQFIALDLLAEQPLQEALSRKWAGYLPLWIPFGLWTRLNEGVASTSLIDLVHKWLHSQDSDALKPLVEKALQEKKVLLLVNGLDEWSSQQAASTTLRALQTFVTDRELPAILTCRPHAYDRLGLPRDWRVGELAGFSREQQLELATFWYASFKTAAFPTPAQQEAARLQADAARRATEFVDELHRKTSLALLGELPLLLINLMRLKAAQRTLPNSRFKATEALTALLLERHPQNRAAAMMSSSDPTPALQFAKATIHDTLAYLAYHMHCHASEGLLDKAEAQRRVATFLKDEHELKRAEANLTAERLLDFWAETVGLLVDKSGQLGFLHRTFQESLAAKHLSNLEFEQQRLEVRRVCEDVQWREVLLCLFSRSTRTAELDTLLNDIESIQSEWLGHTSRLKLLAEAAFGDAQCSPSLAKRIAAESFEQIETGPWMPLRIALLEGVYSSQKDVLASMIGKKLEAWFPSRYKWRDWLFKAMSTWPPSPALSKCLIHALLNDEETAARAAARTLATVFAGDDAIADRLLSLLKMPRELDTTAVLLEALILGWGSRLELETVIAEALSSPCVPLRVVGILGKVQRQEHGQREKETLLSLALYQSPLPWERQEDVVSLLSSGWAGDAEVKAQCIRSLKARYNAPDLMEREIANSVLLSGFPGDTEVASFFAALLVSDHLHPRPHREYFELLAKNFRDAPQVPPAVDRWIRENDPHQPALSGAALVCRSTGAKACLIQDLDRCNFPYWPVSALLEGWGMHDPEVADALRAFVADPAKARLSAEFLPDILQDKVECRRQLLEMIPTQPDEIKRAYPIARGLRKLGIDHTDSEAMNLLISHFEENNAEALICHFSGEPRIRALALEQIECGQGVEVIAKSLGHDEAIRNRLLEHATPLAIPLRLQLARGLSQIADSSERSRKLLAQYALERDAETSTVASIGYHEAILRAGVDTQPQVQALINTQHDLLDDWSRIGQPELAGFLALDRSEVLVDLTFPQTGMPFRVHAFEASRLNPALLAYIAAHWRELKRAFGENTWDRVGINPTWEIGEGLNILAPYIDAQHPLRDRFLDAICDETQLHSFSSTALYQLARLEPRTDRLKEVCLRVLEVDRTHLRSRTWDQMVAAGEILGRQFGGEPELENMLCQQLVARLGREQPVSGILIALCEGWPESSVLDQAIPMLEERDVWPRLLPPAAFQLLGLKGTLESNFDSLTHVCTTFSGDMWEFLPACVSPILRRLARDQALRETLLERLQSGASPGEKASLPRLLARASGHWPELWQWCKEELARQTARVPLPEIGLDLLAGRLCSVAYALADVVV